MNRFDCSGSSGLRSLSITRRYQIQRLNGSSSCRHSTVDFSRSSVRRRIGQALATETCKRDVRALYIVDAELGAVILAEIKLGQVSIKVLGIDVLVNADDAALEDREEPFKSIGVHVAARPFELGMVDGFVFRRAGKLENWRAVAHQAAALIKMLVQARANAAMVKNDGPDRTAALDKAENLDVRLATAGALAGLSRLAHFHIVDFDGFAFATHRAKVAARRHRKPNTVAKMPSGFHAAAQGPLKLAGGMAFLARAKQVDRLKPEPQAKVAILENGADPHGELLAAGVALAEARTGRLTSQAPDFLASGLAMRADGAVRPKPGFDVLESGLLAMKMGGGKDRFCHDLPQFVEANLSLACGFVK